MNPHDVLGRWCSPCPCVVLWFDHRSCPVIIYPPGGIRQECSLPWPRTVNHAAGFGWFSFGRPPPTLRKFADPSGSPDRIIAGLAPSPFYLMLSTYSPVFFLRGVASRRHPARTRTATRPPRGSTSFDRAVAIPLDHAGPARLGVATSFRAASPRKPGPRTDSPSKASSPTRRPIPTPRSAG